MKACWLADDSSINLIPCRNHGLHSSTNSSNMKLVCALDGWVVTFGAKMDLGVDSLITTKNTQHFKANVSITTLPCNGLMLWSLMCSLQPLHILLPVPHFSRVTAKDLQLKYANSDALNQKTGLL